MKKVIKKKKSQESFDKRIVEIVLLDAVDACFSLVLLS